MATKSTDEKTPGIGVIPAGAGLAVTLVAGYVACWLVAATPFTVLGITSAFWSVFAGIAASLFAERTELLDHWRGAASRPA